MGSRKRSLKPHSPLSRMLFADPVADRARSCTSKDAYPSEGHARAVAAMNGMADRLFVYSCRYCESWHLTRRRESRETECDS